MYFVGYLLVLNWVLIFALEFYCFVRTGAHEVLYRFQNYLPCFDWKSWKKDYLSSFGFIDLQSNCDVHVNIISFVRNVDSDLHIAFLVSAKEAPKIPSIPTSINCCRKSNLS